MFRQQATLASRPDMWDFRYQLTVIGQFACNCLAGIVNNGFAIKTDQPHVNVSWQVTGIRRLLTPRSDFILGPTKSDCERVRFVLAPVQLLL